LLKCHPNSWIAGFCLFEKDTYFGHQSNGFFFGCFLLKKNQVGKNHIMFSLPFNGAPFNLAEGFQFSLPDQ